MADQGKPVIGIDLGGTKVLAGVVDTANQVIARAKRNTPAKQGGAAIVATILDAVREAIATAGVPLEEIGGVGIGSPGPLDPEKGIILFSSNMNMKDFPLGPELSKALGHPVVLRNDVRMGGYGEFKLGAGRGRQNVLAAFIGTGIGGFLIQHDQVVVGATGNAGEIGHMILKANGPKCGCGRRGCMEALASKTAISRRLAKAVKRGSATSHATALVTKHDRLKSKDLAAAFLDRDPTVVQEVERAAHYLGLGLGSLINVLGPEVVILGGGVAFALGEPYLELIRQSARGQALVDPAGTIPIVLGELGDNAGVLGSACMARETFLT
jgi:glucokinase